MLIDTARATELLKSFDFETLFIEELGWDHCLAQQFEIEADGRCFRLLSVAEKRGVQVFECKPDPEAHVPPHRTRQLVEREARKYAYEHLIIFTDGGSSTQIWQWVSKEPGKPTAYREHTYVAGQPGLSLLQKLEYIAFPLSEEEALTISGVTVGLRDAFDRDKVTKRFYDRFRTEHAAFLAAIDGIDAQPDREWYASLMLNRLMFVYFIQKKGFLDSDLDYLGNRLQTLQAQHGRDCFLSFYRRFLLRLFHDGLGSRETSPEVSTLLGKVPYLNGGLFDIHRLELDYPSIDIPDSAFERLFAFFDSYTWHLDERPLRADNEISPDVLGYIFEKYVNQRELGAYYTKEDITGYIARSTIVQHVIARASEACAIAFTDGGVWTLLSEDPDRYIFETTRRGTDCEMPEVLAAGLDDVRERRAWNDLAAADVGLPGETWRNYLARRQWYELVKTQLSSGAVHRPSDLVTYNVDSIQFLQDAIDSCEGPDLLRAVYGAVSTISVLDPACGSGAFLFAALNVLERLREACLDRMQAFVDDADRLAVLDGASRHGTLNDFREILQLTAEHPSRGYFVLKSTVVNNLYGVDILDEAVEICKLRLFLKLIAQIDSFDDIEPLPDIDLNIRTGNSLIGFATPLELESTLSRSFDFDEVALTVEESAKEIDELFVAFRMMQTESSASNGESKCAKERLVARLDSLSDQLTTYLARQYGVQPGDSEEYRSWLESHKPFHWWLQFYGIMQSGGFSVVLGNPPYLESREVSYSPKGFQTAGSGAIHAMFVERSLQLLESRGATSMIVPLALVSTQRMRVVQEILEQGRSVWYANFSWRPGKLFDVVNRALTIFTALPDGNASTYSTNYRKWYSDARENLMPTLRFTPVPSTRSSWWVPKLGFEIERAILTKLLSVDSVLGHFMVKAGARVYYRTTGGLYWKVFTDFPPSFFVNGESGHSTRETWFCLAHESRVRPTVALLSSGLFWWWYTVTTNCRDLNPSDLRDFPVPSGVLDDPSIIQLADEYLTDLKTNSVMLVRNQRQTGRTETQSFKIQKSKGIIDQIDVALAPHYGLNPDEVDFIVNYDIEFRLGASDES